MTKENMNNEKTVALFYSKETIIYILDTKIPLQPFFPISISLPVPPSKVPRPYLTYESKIVMMHQVREMNQSFTFGELA